MNTLVSWIDAEAMSGLARDMAAPGGAETAQNAEAGGEATPLTRLLPEDFRMPQHFAPEAFPAPSPAVSPEERGKVRGFLEEIRQKAENSGLIPKPLDALASLSNGIAAAGPGPSSSAGPISLPPLSGQGSAGPAVALAPEAQTTITTTIPDSSRTTFPAVPSPSPAAHPAAGGASGLFRSPFSQPPGSPSSGATAGTGKPGSSLHLPPLGPQSPRAASETPGGTEAPATLAARRHIPHFEVPLGPLATRVRALADWIRRQIDTNDIFILDTQGCPVGDREALPEIVAAAVILTEAARRASAHLPESPAGTLYLDLDEERRLCVIRSATTHGNFTLGLILPEALPPRAAERLGRALKRTVEADAPAPPRLPPRERW